MESTERHWGQRARIGKREDVPTLALRVEAWDVA